MIVDLSREHLEMFIKGVTPNYIKFNNPLVKKAGHRYIEQYGKTSWESLENLTDKELWELINICIESWQ